MQLLLVAGLPAAGAHRPAVEQPARITGGEHRGTGRARALGHLGAAQGGALRPAGALVPGAVEPDLVARAAVLDHTPGRRAALVDVEADGASEQRGGRHGTLVGRRAGGVAAVAAGAVAHRGVDPVGAGHTGRVAAGADPPPAVPHRVGDVVHEGARAGPCGGDARPAEQPLPGGATVPGAVEPDGVALGAAVDARPGHAVRVGDVQPQQTAARRAVGDREGLPLRTGGVEGVARQRADRVRRGPGGCGQGEDTGHGGGEDEESGEEEGEGAHPWGGRVRPCAGRIRPCGQRCPRPARDVPGPVHDAASSRSRALCWRAASTLSSGPDQRNPYWSSALRSAAWARSA